MYMEPILYIDRKKQEIEEEIVPSGRMLSWFYNKSLGKASLHLLMKRKLISTLGGWYMNRRISKKRIDKFIEQNNMDLSIYKVTDSTRYRTFNDFFYRAIEPKYRPIGDGVVSPADGRLLAFQNLKDVSSFFIKGSEFSLKSFLRSDRKAKKYTDGSMVIVRLAPADYHRFHFPAAGTISRAKRIKGRYFSVSPLALKKSLEIFCQNHRVVSTLKTEEFGDILMIEVGATMVGSIKQTYKADSSIKKGEEKGYFAFGGSTVVLLFEKGKVSIDADLIANTNKGLETKLEMGEQIASAAKG
ncbi:phosphatidylserine decarboxylase [Puteibacter caeruleilacunae]|nr:phosphatidylserine decarboxylase [Puteibacter caeruleilacunae]